MTSVVVVDGGGAVLEYVSDAEVVSQDVVLETDAGMCEMKKKVKEEETQVEEHPAVVVEQVPCAELEQCYAAQVVVYDDETYLMQGVAEEQEVETEVLEVGTVEASSHGGGVEYVALDKTIEAAEALLHMDSPSSLREDRSPVPDMLGEMEVEVEVSTENTEPIDPLDEQLTLEGDVQKAKKGRKRKATPQVEREESPDFQTFKKKPRVGKNSTYLWEFLLDLLQDRNTCPKYIKWTQREKGIFKLVDSKAVSRLWGKYKNKPDMNYETMGRALRYYYQRGILSKVEGQRLVYQFNDMPKNIVFIDDDKTDTPSTPPTPCERVTPVTPTSPRGRPLAAQVKVQAAAAPAPAKPTQMLRIVNVSGGPEAFVTLQPQGASPVTTMTGSRTLQVPLMMTTSLGQKISTVTAVNQPSSPLFTTAAMPTGQVSSSSGQKVLIQALPTMVPATGENGQKFTVQLAKLFTIPASQLAQCSVGTVLTQQPKVTTTTAAGGSAGGISLMGTPLTLRTIAPVSVPTTGVPSPGTTQVLRLVAAPQQPSVTTVSAVPTPVPAAATPVSVPVSVPTATVVVTATESANFTPVVPATSERDINIIKVESEDDPSTQVITEAATPSDS